MARNMNSIEQETLARSFRIVNEKVQLLNKVWKTCFEDICYLDYMTSLPGSIGMLLDEIFHITMGYCAHKNKEIQELHAEASQLERVLGVVDPREDLVYQQMSLDRRCMLLQQKVSTLRSKIKRQCAKFAEEQAKLCKELGDGEKRLCKVGEIDVLPNEQKMALYTKNLEELRQEKAKRVAYIAQLQADLRTVAKQLDWEPPKPEQKTLMHESLTPCKQTIIELEELYNVLHKLLKGKLLLKSQMQQTELLPVPDNLSPPPPPPSPEGDPAFASTSALVQQLTREQKQSLLQQVGCATGPRRKEGMLEMSIRRYKQLQACVLTEFSRERAIDEIFHSMRGNINLWWDRCLISNYDRKGLEFTKLDEEAMVALVEQQDQLKAYYYENESLFQLIYEWSEFWSTYLQLESLGTGGAGTKMKKKASANANEKDQQRQVKEKLAGLEVRLKKLCDEYEQRHKKKFTINSEPAMDMLGTLKETRKELTISMSCCKIRSGRVVTRDSLSFGSTNMGLLGIRSQFWQPNYGTDLAGVVLGFDLPGCHVIERHMSPNALLKRPTSSNSSSDLDEDDKRDDELLEEAFASASASTAIKKNSVGSENGARPKTTQGLFTISNSNHKPTGMPFPKMVLKTHAHSKDPHGHVVHCYPFGNKKLAHKSVSFKKETPLVADTTIEANAPSTAGTNVAGGSNVPVNALVTAAATNAASSLECSGSNKVRSKSKQNVKREPSLII